MRIVVFLLVLVIIGFAVYIFFGKSFSNTTGSDDGRTREGKRCESEKNYVLNLMKSINPNMKVTVNEPCPQ